MLRHLAVEVGLRIDPPRRDLSPPADVDGIRTVVDVGANCGAAAVFFAAHYPEAAVHALEPAGEPFRVLAANAQPFPNIVSHNIGLHETDRRVELYPGDLDSETASVVPRGDGPGELVTLRGAGGWLREQGLGTIDVLKVDVEGCEMDVLRGMRDWLPAVKVLYIEYGGLGARQELDDLLAPTHEMALGRIMLTHGEAVFVARDLADERLATTIGELAAAGIAADVERGRSAAG